MSDEDRSEEQITIEDVPEESRYVILVDGARAGFMDYKLRGNWFTAIHTEIDPAFGGRGLGQRLVKHVLDMVRDAGLSLRPLCPFVRSYLQKHPEYDDLVAKEKGS